MVDYIYVIDNADKDTKLFSKIRAGFFSLN